MRDLVFFTVEDSVNYVVYECVCKKVQNHFCSSLSIVVLDTNGMPLTTRASFWELVSVLMLVPGLSGLFEIKLNKKGLCPYIPHDLM